MDEDPFPGWGLRPVQLADRTTIAPFLESLAHPLSDYTFSQLFSWRNSLRILWTVVHGHLCVFANGSGDLTLLLPPIGDTGSDAALRHAFDLMDAYNAGHGVPDRSRVEYVSDELLARIARANLTVEPMGADYVYDTARMIDLAGGDLSSKRQAKNRFLRNYEHRVETYDPARHLDDCRALLQNWKIHQDAQHLEEPNTNAIKRQKESIATDLTLTTAAEIGLRGMVVYVKGGSGFRVQGSEGSAGPANCSSSSSPEPRTLTPEPSSWVLKGFTFGEPLGREQSSITIEKTDLEVKGLAQFIFSEFCRTHWADRPLTNVGDDWGLETLAWTKNSYRPVKMLQKYALRPVSVARVAVPEIPSEPVGWAMPTSSSSIDVATENGGQCPPCIRPGVVVSEPLVRVAGKSDLAAAMEIERTCFDAYRLSRRQLNYLQARSSAVFLVAEDVGGAVVGEGISLVRHHRKGMSGRIYSLAVRPDCRGRKIGQKLLRGMIDELAARGVRRIYLEVERTNTAAIRLYESHGFRSIGLLADYYGPGQAGLHMLCEIPATATLFETAAA